jgi:hypothetical protein
MSTDHEKQSELQKMLALKRYEAPPPRFFKGFSNKVIDRLHSPEPLASQPWWRRACLEIKSKPVLVCASGTLVCGLLLAGLIASMRVEPPSPVMPSPDDNHLVVAPLPNAVAAIPPQVGPAIGTEKLPRPEAPILQSSSSPFDPITIQPIRTKLNAGSNGNAAGIEGGK